MVPLTAMGIALLFAWAYILDPIAVPALGTFTPLPVTTPFAVSVHPKLRDPFMLANEWDTVLVNRDRMMRERQAAALEARDEEEFRRIERDDEEFFKRTGRHLARWKPRPKLALPTGNVTGTHRVAIPGAPPPPPSFTVGGVMVGARITAVLNSRVVAEGDTVQGFKVVHLDAHELELLGITDPWKGKRLRVEVNPAPTGLRFVKAARPRARSAGGRGVTVIPPIVGDGPLPEPEQR